MSFNVLHAEPPGESPWSARLPAIGRMLRDKEPDIIGFQETLAHQVEDLAEVLVAYDWVGGGREDGSSSGEFGPIFFRADRFELEREGIFWLSETPDMPSVGWDATCHRIVTWAELAPRNEGESVTVFNTHFDHLGGTARAQSARLLVQRIDEYSPSGPVVVTGDFNAVALDSALDPLFDELDDVRTSAPVSDLIGSLNSWRTKYGLYNIDFIFAREAEPARFETVNGGYGVDFLSDHFPIVATLYVDESPPIDLATTGDDSPGLVESSDERHGPDSDTDHDDRDPDQASQTYADVEAAGSEQRREDPQPATACQE